MDSLDLRVSYVPGADSLEVSGAMSLVLEADSSYGPTLWLNRRTPAVRFRSVTEESARTGLNARLPDHDEARLATIRFRQPRRVGDRVTVRFDCVARDTAHQLLLKDDLAYASWVEGWYPAPLPERPGGRTGAAPGSTEIVVPISWTTVTNGVRVSREIVGGRAVERWVVERPLMRSFVAGDYSRSTVATTAGTVSLYARSDSLRSLADTVARELAHVVTALLARFGPFPYESYSVVEIPQASGVFDASSEQGFLAVHTDILEDESGRLPLLGHEASHAWWANQVESAGPGSILLSEGMANYGAALAIEALRGEGAATRFLRFPWRGFFPDQNARGYFEYLRRGWAGPLASLHTGDRGVKQLARAKGPWVLRMLRWRLGDAAFFSTLRGIVADFDDRTLRLDDFRSAFIAAAPDSARLETFFEQWLDRPGAPILGLQWSPAREGGVDLVLRQWNDSVFDLDLEVAIRTSEGTVHRRVRLGDREQRFHLSAPGRIEGITLDPGHHLLLWSPEYGWPSALNGRD